MNAAGVQVRLIATFVRQRFASPRSVDTIDCSEVRVDVTEGVLRQDLESLRSLDHAGGDVDPFVVEAEIVAAHSIGWTEGPVRIELLDSLKAFFSVGHVADITQDLLDAKRAEYGIEPNDNQGMKP